MYIKAFHVKDRFAGIEVLVLDLAFCVSVQCIGLFRSELLYVKMSRTCPDLLVRCKCNAERSVWYLLVLKSFNQGKNLGDACLIICAKYGCPVRRNKGASF